MTKFLRRDEQPLQASSPRKVAKPRTFGLVLGIAASCVLLFATLGHGQDTKNETDGIERKAIVHFASLIYKAVGEKTERKIAAVDLEKLQLVRPINGDDYWLELFYRGGDYVLHKIDRLVFLRRDSTAQQMKLPVNLVRSDRMGFPFVN